MKPEVNEQRECDRLDEFLAGELSAIDCERFAAHLNGCDDCQTAVAEQEWINSLLRSPCQPQLEQPSSKLARDIRASINNARLRAGILTGGLAAAVLLLAAGLFALNRSAAESDNVLAEQNEVDTAKTSETVAVRAAVIGGPDTLVVPIESRWPDITIVRVYPAIQPFVDGGSP